MKNSTRVSILVTCLVTATVLHFGFAHHTQQQGPPLNQLYPGPLGMANFGKIVAGEFTGDLRLDAVLFDGSQPKLRVAADTFDSAIAVGGAANDFATLSGLISGKDILLTVSGSGLLRYERDSANSTWIVGTIAGPLSAWGSARLVAVAEINGTGAKDIVGIAANGRTVLTRYGNPNGTFFVGTSFQAIGTTVYGLNLLNWREAGDTAGTAEIALFTNYGTEIYESNGTYLEGIAWSPTIIGTVIRDQGSVLERLAMVSAVNGVDQFYVYGDTDCEGPFAMGATQVVSMAAGDRDGDGDTEVFCGVASERNFKMLLNLTPATQSFDVGAIQEFGYGPPGRDPSINHAGLAPGDFNSDGVLEVAAPAQGDQTGMITVYGCVPVVQVGTANPAQYQVDVSEVEYIPATNTLEFHFTPPATVMPAPPGTTTMMSAKFWMAEDIDEHTIPTPYQVSYVPLPAPETVVALPLPVGYDPTSSHEVFSMIFRQVIVDDANGGVHDIAPAMTGIWAPQPNWNIVSTSSDTTGGMPTNREDVSTPGGSGGYAGGPTPPRNNDDDEPVEDDPQPQ